ncbi:MAG: PAS domain S-box protein [Deltaproteobacteria bacterium]|nr:PAS domain S-box protein [Deltaproteobacteria bacterium]
MEQRIKELEKVAVELKQAEEAPLKSKKRLQTLLQSIQAAVVVHDSDTRIVQGNQTAQDLLGLTEDQMLGKEAIDPDWNFLCEDGSVMSIEEYPVTQVLKNRKPLKNYVGGIRRPDKQKITWVLVNAVPEFDEKDSISQVIVTFMDLTDRKQVEEALRESEEKCRKLFEHAGFAITLIDSETGKRVAFNKLAHESLGYTHEEFEKLSTGDFVVFNKSNADSFEERTRRIIEKGSDTFETKHRKKDGEIRDMLVSNVPILIDGEYYIQGIRLDITDRKQAEKELQKAHDELEQRVIERTAELDAKSMSFKEMNISMRVLLQKREEDKKEMEDKILLNIQELVIPYLIKLKKSDLNEKQNAYANVLESNLNDICSPLLHGLSSRQLKLTPQEIVITSHIRQGMTTKEIAELLGLSRKTIESHRKNIRRKFGIRNRKENLRTHLMSIR